ncbi:MAG: potassium channel family protein [Actinomycetota bacterium]
MGRGRLDAFSDGVFAIAVTLLVLDLKVPGFGAGHGSLAHRLAHGWPAFAAYTVSFAVIGIMWVNHHALLALTESVSRRLVMANLYLLGVVAALPFTTSLFAEYVRHSGADGHVAAAVYGVSMLAAAIGFNLLAWCVVPRPPMARFSAGLVLYAFTIVLAFVSAPLTLSAHGAIALYYAFDQLR